MNIVRLQVSGNRIVELATEGDQLTKAEIRTLRAYLSIQMRIATEAAHIVSGQEVK